MVVYLDYDTVVAINQTYCGAGSGVRDAGGLRGAVEQPTQTFAGVEQYDSLWLKAAVLLRGIASSQYLLDGNKRTGFLASTTFLRLNGVRLRRLPTAHSEVMVRGVAAGVIDLPLAAEYFESAQTLASRWLP